jgi:hypothetical protein
LSGGGVRKTPNSEEDLPANVPQGIHDRTLALFFLACGDEDYAVELARRMRDADPTAATFGFVMTLLNPFMPQWEDQRSPGEVTPDLAKVNAHLRGRITDGFLDKLEKAQVLTDSEMAHLREAKAGYDRSRV